MYEYPDYQPDLLAALSGLAVTSVILLVRFKDLLVYDVKRAIQTSEREVQGCLAFMQNNKVEPRAFTPGHFFIIIYLARPLIRRRALGSLGPQRPKLNKCLMLHSPGIVDTLPDNPCDIWISYVCHLRLQLIYFVQKQFCKPPQCRQIKPHQSRYPGERCSGADNQRRVR